MLSAAVVIGALRVERSSRVRGIMFRVSIYLMQYFVVCEKLLYRAPNYNVPLKLSTTLLLSKGLRKLAYNQILKAKTNLMVE